MKKLARKSGGGMHATAARSSKSIHHGRITKKGDKLVRHMLVEAAHTHVRYAPHSRLSVPRFILSSDLFSSYVNEVPKSS